MVITSYRKATNNYSIALSAANYENFLFLMKKLTRPSYPQLTFSIKSNYDIQRNNSCMIMLTFTQKSVQPTETLHSRLIFNERRL